MVAHACLRLLLPRLSLGAAGFILLLTIGAGFSLATPQAASAQYEADYDNIDDPTDIHVRWRHAWRCIQFNHLDSWPLRRQCWADTAEEDRSRREVRAYSRWIATGVMTVSQIWYGVEQIRNVIGESQAYYRQIRTLIAGFDREIPERSLTRIAHASDRFVRRIDQSDMLDAQFEIPNLGDRYEWLQRISQRSLIVAQEAQRSSADLSENVIDMQARLSPDGNVTVHPIGEGSEYFARTERPPLAADAPANAHLFYETYSGFARPANGYSGGIQPTGDRAAAGMVSGAATLASLDMSPALLASEEPEELCAVDPDGTLDPAVIFQRVQVQAAGAQAANYAVAGDVAEHRETLRTIRAREQESLFERVMKAFIYFFTHM